MAWTPVLQVAIRVLAVALIPSSALSQVTGRRSLPAECGTHLEAQIDVEVDEADAPNGVIVVEVLPPGWKLDSSTPSANSFAPDTGEARWVFFGASVSDTGMDISYTASALSAPAALQTFNGVLRFTRAGVPVEEPIAGDKACESAVSEAPAVTGLRELPPRCQPGKSLNVHLDLDVDETRAPNGVIIVESLPSGWSLDSATPNFSSFDSETGEARWVFFGPSVDDEQMDVTYTATPPGDALDDQRFNGSILFTQSGTEISVPFEQDNLTRCGSETTTLSVEDCVGSVGGWASCFVAIDVAAGVELRTFQFAIRAVPLNSAAEIDEQVTFSPTLAGLESPGFDEPDEEGGMPVLSTRLLGWLQPIEPRLFGQIAIGSFRVRIPDTAEDGDRYSLQIRRPSGTSDTNPVVDINPGPDGILQVRNGNCSFIVCDVVSGDDRDQNGDGDAFDCGEFGDGALTPGDIDAGQVVTNGDVVAILQALSTPRGPTADDFAFNAMDSVGPDSPPSCGGDGAIRDTDLRECFRRSTSLASDVFNHSRVADLVGNCTAGGLGRVVVAGLSTATEINGADGAISGGVVRTGSSSGRWGAIARVPISLHVEPDVSLQTLRLTAAVTPLRDAPALETPVAFVHNPEAIRLPTLNVLDGVDTALVAWLRSLTPPLAGEFCIGELVVSIPPSALDGQEYEVEIPNAGGTLDRFTDVDLSGGAATITVYGPCVGDCDDNGAVAISELIRGVNISLGAQSLNLCPVFDPNRSGLTEINELIQAVNNALDSSGNVCPRRITAPIGV